MLNGLCRWSVVIINMWILNVNHGLYISAKPICGYKV